MTYEKCRKSGSSTKSVHPELAADRPWDCRPWELGPGGRCRLPWAAGLVWASCCRPQPGPTNATTKEPGQNSGEMGPPLTGPGLGLHNLLTISTWGWSFPWPRSTQNLGGVLPGGSPGQKRRRWCQALGSAASCARIRRTATFRGSQEVGQRAQVPDQQESALFSSFLLLKQVLKKLELKSTGHKEGGGVGRGPDNVRTGGEYHFYNLSISDRVD